MNHIPKFIETSRNIMVHLPKGLESFEKLATWKHDMTGERQPPKGGFDTVNPGPKSTFHTATPVDFLIKTHENPAFMGDFPLKRSISMDFPMDLPSPQDFSPPFHSSCATRSARVLGLRNVCRILWSMVKSKMSCFKSKIRIFMCIYIWLCGYTYIYIYNIIIYIIITSIASSP